MNTQQLEYIVTAIRLGSHAAAARKLFVSPQAVSKAISRIERHYGREFFFRKGREMHPTSFALAFANEAEQILDRLDMLRLLGQRDGCPPTTPSTLSVALAATPLLGQALSEKRIASFFSTYPLIEGNFLRYPSDTCLRALEHKIVDAAIVFGSTYQSDCLSKHLDSLSLEVYMHREHDLACKKCLSLEDLVHTFVAYPDDIHGSYATIKSRFRSAALPLPQFKQIAPHEEAIHTFLFAGGLILSGPHNSFLASEDDAVTRPIAHHHALIVPVYLMFNEDIDNNSVLSLCDFLAP